MNLILYDSFFVFIFFVIPITNVLKYHFFVDRKIDFWFRKIVFFFIIAYSLTLNIKFRFVVSNFWMQLTTISSNIFISIVVILFDIMVFRFGIIFILVLNHFFVFVFMLIYVLLWCEKTIKSNVVFLLNLTNIQNLNIWEWICFLFLNSRNFFFLYLFIHKK